MQEDDSVATNSKPITLEDCWSVIAKLTEEISRLKEQLNTNSTNSSLPPSKDFKNPKRTKTKKASVRKRGDQSGHKGHARKLFESSQADEIIKCVWSCPLKPIHDFLKLLYAKTVAVTTFLIPYGATPVVIKIS